MDSGKCHNRLDSTQFLLRVVWKQQNKSLPPPKSMGRKGWAEEDGQKKSTQEHFLGVELD